MPINSPYCKKCLAVKKNLVHLSGKLPKEELLANAVKLWLEFLLAKVVLLIRASPRIFFAGECIGHHHRGCVVSACSAGCAKCNETTESGTTNYQTKCVTCSQGYKLSAGSCSRKSIPMLSRRKQT